MIDLNKYLFSAFAIISLSVPLAIAQDSDDDVEEVIVTGSRIIDPNIISSSQIAVVDGQDIIMFTISACLYVWRTYALM